MSLIKAVREEILLTMYRSVDRMNQHILENNTEAVIAEQALQCNLRSNFEELQAREG